MEAPKEEKKRKTKRRIIFSIIFLLLIHIILNLIQVSFVEEKTVPIQSKSANSLEDEKPRVTTQRICERSPYKWNYSWEGYSDSQEEFVSPRYRLYNFEGRSGTFHVQFFFFDESEHQFDDFAGKEYENVKNILSSKIRIKSENIIVFLDANDNRLIVPVVKKPDASKVYWTYGIVTVPSIQRCINVEVNDIEKETSHELNYQNSTKKVKETISMSLWDYLV